MRISIDKKISLNQWQKSQMVTEDALRLMYSKNKMSMDQIADIYGVCQGTIFNKTRKFKIPSRRTTVIDVTGLRFERWLVVKRIENDKWGADKFLCLCDCGNYGKVSSRLLRTGGSRSCGCIQRESARNRKGINNPCYKGGRTNKEGYVLLTDWDHPNSNKRGRVLEHTVVMAEYLGRPILPGETVHHKNGIRDDNRIENLELWAGKHIPGHRVSDMVQFCIDYLKKYAPEKLKEIIQCN